MRYIVYWGVLQDLSVRAEQGVGKEILRNQQMGLLIISYDRLHYQLSLLLLLITY